ncbi:hypothetical protein SUGI_0311850 [Cryptomeria japonica]|nr:hypothetical protein SUGI_0311850 [Cryptomeria japonica]
MAREDGVSGNGSTNLIDLPDHIISKILCSLSPESVSCASKSCSTLHKIINSADFYNAYVPPHGWIVADCAGAECDPALLFYNTSSNVWRPMAIPDICRDHVLCNPRMVSASGGLILFEATIESPCFEPVLTSNRGHKGKQMVTGSTLVVVNPLTKQSRRLPDPPVRLISENQCMEMVSLGVSYKVILFTTRIPNSIFVYDSTVQIWKRVDMSDPIIPSCGTTTVHSSTGVVYRGFLFWLISIHPFASYLVFYDIKRDRVKRKTCFSEKVYVIGVQSFGIVGVTKQGLCRLDLNRLRWVDLSASDWGQVLGRYMNVDFVCSSEEDDLIWILSLDNGRSAGNFQFRGWTLRKHMDLISYQFCSRSWRRLCPCFVQSDSPIAALPRVISNAKWTKWRFEASP